MVRIEVDLTDEEQKLFLQTCFLRTDKNCIELLEELSEHVTDRDYRLHTALDDLNDRKDILERVRSKVVQGIHNGKVL